MDDKQIGVPTVFLENAMMVARNLQSMGSQGSDRVMDMRGMEMRDRWLIRVIKNWVGWCVLIAVKWVI